MKIKDETIYRNRVLTDFEIKVLEFVTRYEMLHKTKPFVYLITEHTESNDKQVVKSLKRIFKTYPTPLMVTVRDKELSEFFKEGMTIRDLSNEAGITIDCARNHMEGIERLGIKFKPMKVKRDAVKKFKKIKEEKLQGIQITSGRYKGKYGYLDEKLNAVIHIDGIEKIIKVESHEYKELGR